MFNLASIIFSIISSTTAGIFVVATLVAGYNTLWPILIAAGAGFLLSIPLTYLVAKALLDE